MSFWEILLLAAAVSMDAFAVSLGEGDSYYDIDVALATDFNSLRTVHILNYAHRAELDSIQ